MKRKVERNKLFIILSILFVGVLSLTIVYAALSTTLRISGSSEIAASSWNLKVTKQKLSDAYVGFEEKEYYCSIYDCSLTYELDGGADILDTGTISGTTISGVSLTLSKPGDSVTLYYNIENTGTIPAVYSSVNIFEPSITASSGLDSDVEWARANFSFVSSLGNFIIGEAPIDFVLCPGESIMLGVWANIGSSVNSLPNGKISISNLGGDFMFVQGDKSLCE